MLQGAVSVFPFPPPTWQAALRDLTSGQPAARRRAASTLASASQLATLDAQGATQATAILLGAAADLDPMIAVQAAHALRHVPPSDARTNGILHALRTRAAADVHIALLQTIASVRLDAALPDVERLANDADEAIAIAGLDTLVSLAPAKADAALLRHISSASPAMREAACLACSKTPSDATKNALLTCLGDADASVRFAAALSLAQLGDGAGREQLERAARVPATQWDAVSALITLRQTVVLAKLLPAIIDPAVSALVAGAIVRLSPPADSQAPTDAQEVLRRRLFGWSASARGVAIEQLSLIKTPWATALLRDAQQRFRLRHHRADIEAALQEQR